MAEENSDFGKGLVICLVKFAEHFVKLHDDIKMYKEMQKTSPKGLFDEASAIHMWANGATDHLYEIEVPEGREWDMMREKVSELQKRGLDMGHSFVKRSIEWKQHEVVYLMELVREISLMIDEKLGLKPQLGSW